MPVSLRAYGRGALRWRAALDAAKYTAIHRMATLAVLVQVMALTAFVDARLILRYIAEPAVRHRR